MTTTPTDRATEAKYGASANLTPRQERFVGEYLLDLNATQAAIRAGYAPRSARVTAARLLTKADVRNRVNQLKSERSERLQIDSDWVLLELLDVVKEARSDGRLAQALRGLELIGKHTSVGAFQDKVDITTKQDSVKVTFFLPEKDPR